MDLDYSDVGFSLEKVCYIVGMFIKILTLLAHAIILVKIYIPLYL